MYLFLVEWWLLQWGWKHHTTFFSVVRRMSKVMQQLDFDEFFPLLFFSLFPLIRNRADLQDLKGVVPSVHCIRYSSHSFDCYLFYFQFFYWFFSIFFLAFGFIWLSFFLLIFFSNSSLIILLYFIFVSNLVNNFIIAICFFSFFYYFFLKFIPQYFVDWQFGFMIFLNLSFIGLVKVSWLESQVWRLVWVDFSFCGSFLKLIFFSISSFNFGLVRYWTSWFFFITFYKAISILCIGSQT